MNRTGVGRVWTGLIVDEDISNEVIGMANVGRRHDMISVSLRVSYLLSVRMAPAFRSSSHSYGVHRQSVSDGR